MSNFRKKLEEKAERLKIPGYKILTTDELKKAIFDHTGKKEPEVIEGKAVEVKTPESKPSQVVASAPAVNSSYYGQPINMAINVPIPAVNLQNRPAPAWWEIAAEARNAALYMICGAALYALVTVKLL